MTAIFELEFDTDVARLLAHYRAWHVANQVNRLFASLRRSWPERFCKPLSGKSAVSSGTWKQGLQVSSSGWALYWQMPDETDSIAEPYLIRRLVWTQLLRLCYEVFTQVIFICLIINFNGVDGCARTSLENIDSSNAKIARDLCSQPLGWSLMPWTSVRWWFLLCLKYDLHVAFIRYTFNGMESANFSV